MGDCVDDTSVMIVVVAVVVVVLMILVVVVVIVAVVVLCGVVPYLLNSACNSSAVRVEDDQLSAVPLDSRD